MRYVCRGEGKRCLLCSHHYSDVLAQARTLSLWERGQVAATLRWWFQGHCPRVSETCRLILVAERVAQTGDTTLLEKEGVKLWRVK